MGAVCVSRGSACVVMHAHFHEDGQMRARKCVGMGK